MWLVGDKICLPQFVVIIYAKFYLVSCYKEWGYDCFIIIKFWVKDKLWFGLDFGGGGEKNVCMRI